MMNGFIVCKICKRLFWQRKYFVGGNSPRYFEALQFNKQLVNCYGYVKISSLLNSFSSFTMDVLPSEDWSKLLCSVPLRGRAERRIGQVLTLNCPEQAAWCRALNRPTQHITNTRSKRDTREKYPAFLFSTLLVRITVENSFLKLSWCW